MTTICMVRRNGMVAIGGDGQVSLGQTVMKASAHKVRRLGKGDDRPINVCADRMALLAALESVDRVVAFEEDTPLALILAMRPEVLVKGGDWAPERIVGAEQVRAWGGSVHAIAFEHERSTTAMLARIRQAR